jgi:hypothetical protein
VHVPIGASEPASDASAASCCAGPSSLASAAAPSPVASLPASEPLAPSVPVVEVLPSMLFRSAALYVGNEDVSIAVGPHIPVSGWQLWLASMHVDWNPPEEVIVTWPTHEAPKTKRSSLTRSVGICTSASRKMSGMPSERAMTWTRAR